ncbi:21958_t:CDS:2, partial [Gigaspora margarita]
MTKTKKPSSIQPTNTRSSISTSRPITSTISKSTVSTAQSNNTRSVTSTSRSTVSIAQSNNTVTQPTTSTTQLSRKFIIKPLSPITPSRSPIFSLSSPITHMIQEEYENSAMKRNRELENENQQLWREIDELRNITRQQERTTINLMDQINFLTSTVGTLVCKVDELHDLYQPKDQDSLELVIAESSTNALRRSTSVATTELNSVSKDDKDRKKELRKQIFVLLKEKGVNYDLDYNSTWSAQKDRLTKNTIPVLIKVLGDRFNTNQHELTEILKRRHKSSRNTLLVRRDPFRNVKFNKRIRKNTRRIEKMSRRTSAFKYLSNKNDKRIKKYNKNEMKLLLNNSDIHSPEISDSDEERDDKGKIYVNVYDLSWRSEELRNFIHNVLDVTMVPNYMRPRRKSFVLNLSAPEGLPDWAVAEGN